MNISAFDYVLNGVKDDLQGYSNFRKCIEREEKSSSCSYLHIRYYGKDRNKLYLQNV
jgi:hypothetical protein